MIKTKVHIAGIVVTRKKDTPAFLKAIEMAGVKVNIARLAKITGMSPGGAWDAWRNIQDNNEVTCEICIDTKVVAKWKK